MEELIQIATINDFIFCPVSIYFHGLMGGTDRTLYQSSDQINGTAAHSSVDNKTYSTKKDVLQGMTVCSDRYGIMGKIDTFDIRKGILTERKKHLSAVYPGHIYQLYGQYFCLVEEGYEVNELRIYSMDDNKVIEIPHPKESPELVRSFEETLAQMHDFDMSGFVQSNIKKCSRCIYEPMCANSGYNDDKA